MNISVNRLNVSYSRSGKGKVIVLLHGWGDSQDTFTELAAALQKSFTVVSVDLPGFGASDQPHAAWGVGEYVQFVHDFLRTLGIKELYALVGHSFGGRICIKGVASGVLKPQKLVLIGAAGIRHSRSPRNVAYAAVAKLGKVLFMLPGLKSHTAHARERLYKTAKASDYISAGTMRDIFTRTIHEDLTHVLPGIGVPTLLAWGSEDDQTPLSDARIMQSAIHGSWLKIQQRAGHFVHREYPQKVADWTREFLA